jgi:hypothetical protein
VPEHTPDLRPAELCIVGALLAGMLAISVWPAGIAKHSFACLTETQTVSTTQPSTPVQIGLECVSATQPLFGSSATSAGVNP